MARGSVSTMMHIRERPVLSLALYFIRHAGPSACARAVFQRRTAACRQLCDPRFPPHPTCPGWDSPGHRWWQFGVSPPLPPARRSGHAAPPDAQIPGPLRFLGRRHLTPLSATPGPPRTLPSVAGGTAPGHELGQVGAPALSPSPAWNRGSFFLKVLPLGRGQGSSECAGPAFRNETVLPGPPTLLGLSHRRLLKCGPSTGLPQAS